MKFDQTKTRDVPKELQRGTNRSARTSIFNQDRSEIVYLSTDQLLPYNKQARRIFDKIEIESLAQTINEHGIRQPLTVLRINSDPVKFEVISGERRLRAAKLLNLPNVPCIIIEDENKAEEIALIENIHRQDLHPIELAGALSLLVEKLGRGGQTNLEKKLGIAQSKISELLKLHSLSSSVKEELLRINYRGRDNLRKLMALKNEESQLSYLKTPAPAKRQRLSSKSNPLLQIGLIDNNFIMEKNTLSILSIEQKDQIKILLKEIIENL